MKILAPADLRKIAPNISPTRASALTPLILDTCAKYGINTYLKQCAFIATIVEESGGFRRYEENLNYSISGLMKTWPTRFKTTAIAAQYARNPQKIANHVYCNRLGNGNEASGDGWNNRGSGAMQITGKDMISAYAKYVGLTLPTAAGMMRIDDATAIDSAGWYLAIYNKAAMAKAATGDFRGFTISVNGGLINYDTRLKYYNACLQVLK